MERFVTAAVAALFVLTISASPTWAQTPAPPAPNMPRAIDLLEGTGLNYSKNTPNSWIVRFEANNGDDIPVIVAQAPGILVLVSVVSLGKETKPSLDLYRELLQFNIDADYIKVGIDDDGDYQVRADLNQVTATVDSLKALLDQVASAADQLRPTFAKYKKK